MSTEDNFVRPKDVEAFGFDWGRLALTASDEGRAIFGMLDLDRDRQLGAREVLDTYARVSACDRDGDGRVSPEEIPHHMQLTLARGGRAPREARGRQSRRGHDRCHQWIRLGDLLAQRLRLRRRLQPRHRRPVRRTAAPRSPIP